MQLQMMVVMRDRMMVGMMMVMMMMIQKGRRGMRCTADGGADGEDVLLPRVAQPLPCRYQLQSDQMPLGSVGGRTV